MNSGPMTGVTGCWLEFAGVASRSIVQQQGRSTWASASWHPADPISIGQLAAAGRAQRPPVQ
jgi:hypothetical protein